MKIDSLYSELIAAKNSTQIPLLKNNKTIESRYNPEADAKNQLNNLNITADFILLLGIGSGCLINEILNIKSDVFILAVENTEDDLQIIRKSSLITEIEKKSNCKFSTIEKINQDLKNYFLPVFYTKFQVIENKNWIRENNQYLNVINNIINNTIKEISQDFSVQAHFGKIWMSNILSNLKHFNDCNSQNITTDINKTALILAAGPSLDEEYKNILKNRNKYFIISTDTSLSAMKKRNITVDAVVSIDAQYISSNHFLSNVDKDTIYFFDLCGNNSAINKIFNKTKNIFFINTGHPFTNLISDLYPNSIINLTAGSGTVTIAAIDLAIKMGFAKIEVMGADFGYINNKTYTSGTYLDNLYNHNSSKIFTNEAQYSKLMYRTELISLEQNKKSTEILQSYEKSLIEFIKKAGNEIQKIDNIFYITNHRNKKINYIKADFNYNDFIKILKNKLVSNLSKNLNKTISLSIEEYAFLPLMSFNKKYDNNIKITALELNKTAIKFLER